MTHPIFLLSLGTLIVNDHFLKDAFGNVVTGKLSDFAGLVVAPIVVAALLRVRRRGAVVAVVGAVGMGFAAINVFPPAARLAEAAMSFADWRVWSDPTDLVALPFLLVAYHLLTRRLEVASADGRVGRAVLGRAVLAIAALACVATSTDDDHPTCEASSECDDGHVCCDGYCTNLDNRFDCGACGVRCDDGEMCDDGMCVPNDPAVPLSDPSDGLYTPADGGVPLPLGSIDGIERY